MPVYGHRLVFAIITNLACKACASLLEALTSRYIVIIDAGSTGSRAHAFHYKSRVMKPTQSNFVLDRPVDLPESIAAAHISPGISSFINRLDAVKPYIQKLLNDTADEIRKNNSNIHLSHVPLYLGATAGMRAIGVGDAGPIMVAVRSALHDGPFNFERDEQARVLAGEEEGAFGWLAVNYKFSTISAKPRTTYGALDMGGESVQIAFEPEEPSILAGMFPMHFGSLADGPIHLYTHSFMRSGKERAFRRVSALLFATQGHNIEHPCLPRGVTWQVDFDYGVSTSSVPNRSIGPIKMLGAANFERCADYAEQLIVETPCFQPPCSMLGVYQPVPRGITFAMLGECVYIFYHLVEGTLVGATLPPLQALYHQASDFCGMSFDEQTQWMSNKPGLPINDPVLTCWLAVWVYTFLVHGLHFMPDSRNLFVGSEVSSWAQGQAVYEVNFFPYRVVSNQSMQHLLPLMSAAQTRPGAGLLPAQTISLSRREAGALAISILAVGFALRSALSIACAKIPEVLIVGVQGRRRCRVPWFSRVQSHQPLLVS